MTKEDLESKFEDCFDAATHATGGGYEADCTSREGLWRLFKVHIDEYAKCMATKFYEFEEGVPAEDMKSNYDWFISQQPNT